MNKQGTTTWRLQTAASTVGSRVRRIPKAAFLALLSLALSFAAALVAEKCDASWPYTAVKDGFSFQADFPLQPHEQLIHEIYRQRAEIARTLKIHPSNEKIDIYLFARRSTYDGYMKHYFPSVSPRRAMFIKSNSPGNVFAYASPEFDVDLRHESTHAILHAALPMVPLWLDEGLAEYFEQPINRRAFENPYLAQVQRSVRWQRPPSLKRLESLTSINEMGGEEYRQAWAWVHFMLHGPKEARQTLVDYFQSVQKHQPPLQLSDSLAANVPNLERAFSDHFKRWHR